MADTTAVHRTAAAFFCNYLVGGVFGPFLSPTLVQLGYGRTQVGLIVAAMSFCSALMPLIVGRLSDNYVSLAHTIRWCCTLSVLCAVLMWSQAAKSVSFCVLLMTMSVCRAPLGSLLETLATQVSQNVATVYGRIRLTGSLGFIAAATAAGWWVEDGRPQRFFPTVAGLLALACATGFLLPHERRHRPRATTHGFWSTLDRSFWLWLGAVMLHWFAFAPYQYGFSMLLHEQNVPHAISGALWSVGVLAEVLAFLLCGQVFRHVSAYRVLQLAFGAGALRWLLLGSTASLPVIVLTQLLHGPAFALFHTAAMQTLGAYSQGRYRSSYQGLYGTAMGGVATCAGTAVGGFLHGHMPFRQVILCMLPVQALALLLLWATSRRTALLAPGQTA